MTLLHMTVSGGLIILLTVIIRRIGAKRMPKSVIMTMWLIAVLRLLVPVSVPIPIPEAVLKHCGEISADNASSSAVKPDNVYTGIISNDEYTILPSVLPDSSQVTDNPGTTANTVQPTNRSALPKSLALAAWLAGVLPLAVVFTSNYILNMRRLKCAIPCRHPFVEEWQSRHKLKRNYTIGVSDMISSPLTYGTVKPVILLSKSAQAQNESSLSYILAHEYIHIKHFDVLFKIVLAAILCIHWFNPLVWVMYILANRDIELSCDEAVVKMFGESSKASYAYTLINLEAARSRQCYFASGFCKNAIEERIGAIMKTKKNNVFAIILAALLIFVGTVAAFAVPVEGRATADEVQDVQCADVLGGDDINDIFGRNMNGEEKKGNSGYVSLQKQSFELLKQFSNYDCNLIIQNNLKDLQSISLESLDDYKSFETDELGVAYIPLSQAEHFVLDGTAIITDDVGEPFRIKFGAYDTATISVARNTAVDMPGKVEIGYIINGEKVKINCNSTYDRDNKGCYYCSQEFDEDTEIYGYIYCSEPMYINVSEITANSGSYINFTPYTYTINGETYNCLEDSNVSYALVSGIFLEEARDVIIGNGLTIQSSEEILKHLKAGDKVRVTVDIDVNESDDIRWAIKLCSGLHPNTDMPHVVDYTHNRKCGADVTFEIPANGDYIISFINDSMDFIHINSAEIEIIK